MSCRTTSGGSVSIRLARAFSGLPDATLQSLFHALKREGNGCPEPTIEMKQSWRDRQRVLLKYAKLTDAQREHSERDLLRAMEENIDGDIFHAWHRLEVRARQEIVLDSMVGNIIDLAPPGSQSDQYQLGEDGRPNRVWYSSYGSNLSKDRFLTYIQGGTPDGSATSHPGCRDKSLPLEDIPIRFEGRMHFSGYSYRWGSGGVAFMDNEDNLGRALGRAYNVSIEQFDDIAAQENGRGVGTISTKTEEAINNGSSILLATGLYGNLVHIGDYQGAPAFTFTGDFSAEQALLGSFEDKKAGYIKINEPSPNYIRVIGSGLKETFDLSVEQQVDYIRGSLGSEDMTRSRIKEILESPAEVFSKPIKSSNYGGSTYPYSGYGSYTDEYGTKNYWDDEDWSSTTKRKTLTEEQMSDEEYSDEMARFLISDRDTPWFNEPRYATPKVTATLPAYYDEEDPDSSYNTLGCAHCKSKNHFTHECQTFVADPVNNAKKIWEKETEKNIQESNMTKETSSIMTRSIKRCVICKSPAHSMHECPDLVQQPSTVTTSSFTPIVKSNTKNAFTEPLFPPTVARTDISFRASSKEQIQRVDKIMRRIGVIPDSSESLLVLKKAVGFYSPSIVHHADLELFLLQSEVATDAELSMILLSKPIASKKTIGKRPGGAGTRAKLQTSSKKTGGGWSLD